MFDLIRCTIIVAPVVGGSIFIEACDSCTIVAAAQQIRIHKAHACDFYICARGAGHAIIEQVFADLKGSALAHLPSGSFAANSAWLALAAIAFNLVRAAGTIAAGKHARATTATLRTRIINIPARVVISARRITLRLPAAWPWKDAWTTLFHATIGPPRPATT